MEEEDKVHDDSQTEVAIRKPVAEHKVNCPLQTNSTKQGRWYFLKQNLKIPTQSYALWLKCSVPIKIPIKIKIKIQQSHDSFNNIAARLPLNRIECDCSPAPYSLVGYSPVEFAYKKKRKGKEKIPAFILLM